MYKFFKRMFDLLSALVLFLTISPLFIILIIISFFSIGHPVFFIQKRSGINQKQIKVIKFRTMTNKKDENGNLLPDEQRMTKYGKFLRSTSLDELPQLLNIIIGSMSVIGPRPLPVEYDNYYKSSEMARFNVRSGLIQPEVLYNKITPTWDEQLEWESKYAQNLNLVNDLKIFFAVFKALFNRSSSNYGGFVRKSLIEERGDRDNDCINTST